MALGVQLSCVLEGSPLLIDEVEHGLEPHRIRHLIRYLRNTINNNPDKVGQVIMTSHSATVIVEIPAENLYVVRSANGETIVQNVSKDLQSTIRVVPDSLLGLKVVVCEGKTELGICRSMEKHWENNNSNNSIVYEGTVLVDGGGGDHSSKIAFELASLGYSTCLFIDGDRLNSLNPNLDTIKANGVFPLYWANDLATEERIALDLSWSAIKKVVEYGVAERGEDSIYDCLCNCLGKQKNEIGTNLDRWLEKNIPEGEIRKAIGSVAKQKDWFKRIDHGEKLGDIIIDDLPNIHGKDTASVLENIEGWIYGKLP